uniref:Uncharacterized protein n=1 Tax=Plectus sambesii TaxID=2011161 RepID=A0A914WLX9_9BILA
MFGSASSMDRHRLRHQTALNLKPPMVSSSPSSPRLRRLAAQLTKIEISLDPPSPPHASPLQKMIAEEKQINPKLLTVPGDAFLDMGEVDEDGRTCSPPPDRRCSCASTASDVSVGSSLLSATLPTSGSYQNLLSPVWSSVGKQFSLDEERISSEVRASFVSLPFFA